MQEKDNIVQNGVPKDFINMTGVRIHILPGLHHSEAFRIISISSAGDRVRASYRYFYQTLESILLHSMYFYVTKEITKECNKE